MVKLNREKNVQSTDSFFLNHKEFIRISCIVEKCWKIAFHLKVDKKRGSPVVSALAFSARCHGFDPRSRREKIRWPNTLSLVSFAGMTLKCAVLQIGTLTGGPMWRESHPMCRLKKPYSSFHSAKPVCTMYACSLSSRDPSDRDVNWRPLCREVTPCAG